MDFSEKEKITLPSKNLQQKKRLEFDDVLLSQGFLSGDFPLSFAQQRIWFLEQLNPGSPANHISDGLRIHGPLDVPSLEKSLNLVTQRHHILRTSFDEKSGVPAQTVLRNVGSSIRKVDLRHTDEGSKERKIEELSLQDRLERFDLASPPLMRLTLIQMESEEYLLLLTTHRIIADRTSLKLLFDELIEFYDIVSKGEEIQPPGPVQQFSSFAHTQQTSYKCGLFLKQTAYWIDRLHDAPFVLSLPTDRPRSALQTFNGAILIDNAEKELSQDLFGICIQERMTLSLILLTVFDVLLHRYTREEDILVGCPTPGRTFPDTKSLIGLFENIIVHRADLTGDPTFRELLLRVKTARLDSLANQDLPFEKLVEELQPERTLSHSPLVQVMFSVRPKRGFRELDELRFEYVRADTSTSKHDLALEIEEEDDGITLVWKYNTDLFENQTIERMSGHFLTLLNSILENPDQKISELNILTKQEKEQILQTWNQTESEFPENRRFEELFQEQVNAAPKSIAVICGKQELTYKELDTKSNQLAGYLNRNGIGRGKIVALFIDRSIEMCIAVLGIIKSGACYLPIDITYPPDRVEFMIQDSNASAVLTQNSLRSKLNQSVPVICVDSDWKSIGKEKKEPLPLQGNSRDLIYIIYTSGSTGTPKGVAVCHRNLVNQALGVKKVYSLQSDDRPLQFASISFDVAAEELYPTWLTGATLVLRHEHMLASFNTFLKEVEKYKITLLNLPTAYWHELVQEIQSSSLVIPSCVRAVIVGGEKVSYPAYKQWTQIAGDSVHFFNGYGPTETTITSTIFSDSQINRKTADSIQDVPIGRPIANTRIYVLDKNMQPVAVGVPGELWIGGEGVSCGYLNRPELTTSRFLTDPFVNDRESRIYKTGDLVRYLPDGNLQFYGRVDNQVKIRGFRIELGEIETALSQHASVREAAVTAPTIDGSARIVAYASLHDQATTSRELKEFLSSKLPDYMIPAIFIFLENLPFTATGKIDRKNLPLPENLDGESQKDYVPPGDELELKLTGIWQKLLNVTRVGITDNFFDLGGHSLLAVRLFSQIEKETGKNLPLATLFEAPTIEQLAAILKQDGWNAHWSSLVPIQPNGELPPFFCIHAIGGNVVGYQPLGEYMSPNQPIYGLQARGLDGKQTPHVILEEMAADYIREIKTLQPEGPYHLGGLSSGGTIAFEMARQLFEMGDQVGVVALFDTEAPTFLRIVSLDQEVVPSKWTAYQERIQYHFDMLFVKKQWKSHLKQKFRTVKRRVRTRLKLANYKFFRKLGKPLPKTLLRVHEANNQALLDYHPGYYPGDLILFLAMQKAVGQKIAPDVGWKPFARMITVCNIPGDHLSILKEPNVKELAEALQQCIDEFSTKNENRIEITNLQMA